MKPIEAMTVEEMTEEMRQYKTRKNEKYIFVSYAHLDRQYVYPVVLGWMRRGYNVYIDLDFVNHGSDEHWATMMQDRMESNNCALAAAFRSQNAAFSYAALLELLTARSDSTKRCHRSNDLPIDIIQIEAVPADLELDESVMDMYEAMFEKLKSQNGKSFANNEKEYTLMKQGIESWYKDKHDSLKEHFETAEQILDLICNMYKKEASDFFNTIAYISGLLVQNCGLNGNRKDLNDPMDQRFDALGLKRKPLPGATEPPAPQPAVTTPAAPVTIPAASAPTPAVPAPAVSAVKPEPARKVEVPAQSTASYPRYYTRSDNRAGTLVQTGEKAFTVLAGAEMRKDHAPSCQYLKLRQQIMNSGVLLDRGETYEFIQDYAVSSLSAAAAALTGRSVNGNDFWVKEEDLFASSADPFEDLFAEPHNDSAFRVSIANVRFLFEVDEDFCRRVGELRRNGLPWGGRGALDLAMAAILGGCNKVTSPAQINYYKYAIADMDNKRDSEGLGATWTWSSNCRKLLYGSKAGSGKINADTDAYYASLPEDTAVEEILEAFRQGRPFFQVEKKELVTQCLEAFMGLL